MIELTVCIGTSCHLRGSEEVIKTFKKLIKSGSLEKSINLKGTFCMGRCSEENVVVSIDSEIFNTTPEEAEAFFFKNIAVKVK